MKYRAVQAKVPGKDRQRADVRAKGGSGDQAASGTEKLEEILNFSNLTQFRKSLLEAIPKLQENDLVRFVITKHGEPAAVIMSYHAYGVLKRIAELMIQQDNAKDRDVALREAYERMTQSKVEASPRAKRIAEKFESVSREFRDFERLLGQISEESAEEATTPESQSLARE